MGKKRWHCRAGRVERGVYQEAKRIWRKAVRDAKRKCWESLFEHGQGTDVWTAVH